MLGIFYYSPPAAQRQRNKPAHVVGRVQSLVALQLARGQPMPEQAPMSARPTTLVREAFTKATLKALLKRTFDKEYGEHYSKNKAVANSAEASPRTSEKWTKGENLPSLVAFFNMAFGQKQIPALQAEVRRLSGTIVEHEMSPDWALQEIGRIVAFMEGK